MRFIFIGLFFLLSYPSYAQKAQLPTTLKPKMDCEKLAGFDISKDLGESSKVLSASVVDGKCHVKGLIKTTTNYEVWLPLTTYEGRFLQIGCDGLCGRLDHKPQQVKGCAHIEKNEFVIASTDMGHKDPSANSWGQTLDRRHDFGHRAQVLTAATTKEIINKYYGEYPLKSYFIGCSEGGRQGLLFVQKYQTVFDGVVVGAPALDWTTQNTFHHSWTVQKNKDAAGKAILISNRLPVLNKLVLATCGNGTNVVSSPFTCPFDPLKHICKSGEAPENCLSEGEARVAKAIYDGPRNAMGERITAGGLAFGSEANWAELIAPEKEELTPSAKLFSENVLKNLAFEITAQTMTTENLIFEASTLPKLAESQKIFDATKTNINRYFNRSAKLIIWHGLADQDIPPASTLAWWNAVRNDTSVKELDRYAKLFMIPGLAHCRGGVANQEFDSLTPLIKWVEDNIEPQTLANGVQPTLDVKVERFLGDERYSKIER